MGVGLIFCMALRTAQPWTCRPISVFPAERCASPRFFSGGVIDADHHHWWYEDRPLHTNQAAVVAAVYALK
jgi:hypothetical protein